MYYMKIMASICFPFKCLQSSKIHCSENLNVSNICISHNISGNVKLEPIKENEPTAILYTNCQPNKRQNIWINPA